LIVACQCSCQFVKKQRDPMVHKKSCQRLLLLSVLLSLPGVVAAEPPKIALSAGLEFSDNITKAPQRVTEEWTNKTRLDFKHKLSQSRLKADIAGLAMYEDYQNNIFKDRLTAELRLAGAYQFSRQFSWLLDDKLSDVPQDRAKPNTPDNTVRLNILRTGPKYTKFWSQRSFTDVTAEFIDVAYDGPQTESQRVRGGVTQNWLYSSNYQFGLEGVSELAKIDDVLQTETQSATASVLLGKVFRNGSWLGKVGYTNLTRESDSAESTVDGPVAQFEALYKVTGKVDFTFEVGRLLSDSASDQVLNNFGDLRVVTVVDVVTQNSGKVALNYEINKRDSYQISFATVTDDYRDQAFRERNRITKALWLHSHTPRLLSELSLSYELEEFSDTEVTTKTWVSGYKLNYFAMKNLRLTTYISYDDGRNDNTALNYQEVVGGVAVSWISGK
jgi:hypothetical protein